MIRQSLILALLAAVTLQMTSCNAERHLAKKFTGKRDPGTVLLIAPDFSYKYNFKLPEIDDFDSLPRQTQDSLLFYNSELLQYLDDSVLIRNYVRGMSSGLRSLGINVHTSLSIENFVNKNSDGLIVNIVQLELEEYYEPISDKASFGDEELYRYELDITAININSWFELARVNHQDSLLILYGSNTLTDRFDGGFRYFPFTGDVKYTYTIDSLTVEDIYSSAISIGNLYAGLLYDYLMNDYIRKNISPGHEVTRHYTYDRISGRVKKSKGQRLTRLK